MGRIFDIINVPFGYLMRWFNDLTGHYLIALLLFAVAIKIILLPLALKQQKNQIKQAQLRPLEHAIRQKYAGRNDKATQQKVQEEVMQLYQQQGYSPLSGCLPLLIQLPIIFSLYKIIREPLTYICRIPSDGINKIIDVLKGLGLTDSAGKEFVDANQIGIVNAIKNLADKSPFSGIENFAEIDKLNFTVGSLDISAQPSFSKFGWLWLIPLIVFVTSYLSMKISRRFQPQQQATGDAAMSMKIMDFTMPLMSTFFCFAFSGAIGVYWIYQNVLGILQTIILAKLMPLPTFTEEDYKEAERQLAGKKKKNAARDPSVPLPRSLHHIDDDDDDIPPSPPEKEASPDAPPLKDSEAEKFTNK